MPREPGSLQTSLNKRGVIQHSKWVRTAMELHERGMSQVSPVWVEAIPQLLRAENNPQSTESRHDYCTMHGLVSSLPRWRK
jgi:hypothetical protein